MFVGLEPAKFRQFCRQSFDMAQLDNIKYVQLISLIQFIFVRQLDTPALIHHMYLYLLMNAVNCHGMLRACAFESSNGNAGAPAQCADCTDMKFPFAVDNPSDPNPNQLVFQKHSPNPSH